MVKVLIAEDDRIHLMRLAKVLGNFSDTFEVVPARDGQEAIDILKAQHISVLVTDIQMPRVDGLALLAYVSQHHPNMPCFVMSAYGTPQMKAKLPKDLLRFFPKPFDVDDLGRSIVNALEQEASQDGVQSISVESFLHMIDMEQASYVVEVKTPEKSTGVLYFEKGTLVDAECGNLKGEAAALELIPRKKASFGFKFYPERPTTRKIFTGLNQLIQKTLL